MAEEFKEKKKPNFNPIGRSGTLVTAKQVESDYLAELLGTDGQKQYHKMLLSDATVRKNYHALSNPIKSAEWDIEPASEDAQDIKIAALIKQIIFHDLPEGFTSKLDEILTFPWHGHSIFEIIHANKNHPEFGPYTGLLNLAFRDQRTITEWNFSPEGLLLGLKQEQEGDIRVNVELPAEVLMIFYNEKKGNDNGYPFCRMMFGNYKRKLLYKQLQAIGIERAAIPVPHLMLPPGIDRDSEEYADAVDQLAAFTQAEQSFFVTPEGYTLNYNQTATFDPAKVQVAIKAENEEMAGSLVAMWLEMGIGGNSAVGSSTGISSDFFKDGIEYIADKISDVFNIDLIPQLVRMNFGDVKMMPKLIHNGIADEAGEELMRVVTGYVEKGVIIPDEPLEDHLRKVHSLPPKVEGAALENRGLQDDEKDRTGDSDDAAPEPTDDEVELSDKKKIKTPKQLIDTQAPKISDSIRGALEFSSAKYINDVMARYRQLAPARKQAATSKVVMGGTNKLKKELKKSLTETVSQSIDMAKSEIPSKKNVELSMSDREMDRMTEKYGDISEIKLNDFSKLPTHLQVLLAKQSELIADDSVKELKKRIDFSFSGIQTKSADENVIKQAMEDDAQKFTTSNNIDLKGVNAASLMVNEGRDSFFFDEEVLEEIHSFTFTNFSPKSDICKELAGTTFKTNDAESLRYQPPLHHNCKSYLRANLKESKGVEKLELTSLAPSAKAKKSITL